MAPKLMTNRSAQTFARAIAISGVSIQRSIDLQRWEDAQDYLEDVANTVKILREYVRSQL